MHELIAVIGLGYVGLPVAVACARAFPGTVGFDKDPERVAQLQSGFDRTGEIEASVLRESPLRFSADPADLRESSFYVVAVPTPVDENKQPDLTALVRASETVGAAMQPGAVVVYESTVYPGVTEDVCRPVLARVSGLRAGIDFHVGYSPERINPGDKEHTLSRIIKVVSGDDAATLARVASAYERIVPAGVHRAPSIKVAEAAKVVENTQRDLNIALMNELAIIFDKLGIRTRDVLRAASTKWNFMPFSPGLVGGHCIGVDPYYLTAKAKSLGYHPEVILAGRRINDSMGVYVAQHLVKMLIQVGIPFKGAKVALLGLTFKENVPDLRNSRVPDIIKELLEFGIKPIVHDPLVDPDEARATYGIQVASWTDLAFLDGLILAVPHRKYLQMPTMEWVTRLRNPSVLVDVKSVLVPTELPAYVHYWSL